MILTGDCLERLKELPDNSVDSVVTDPPYGLKFMGKKWDYDVPSVDMWRECLRVLKPGGHLLGFGGTRTYHRLVCSIEDAGFEIRDQIQWLYGSGFPKSHDISKGIDRLAGAEREVVGQKDNKSRAKAIHEGGLNAETKFDPITAPATDLAKQWQGWGTALKPANEPIVLARKPLSESTVAKNVIRWGVGGLNIDASRIGTELIEQGRKGRSAPMANGVTLSKFGGQDYEKPSVQGRWPANLLLDETAAQLLDEQSGPCKTGNIKAGTLQGFGGGVNTFGVNNPDARIPREFKTDAATGASRFFYCAKASKSERNAGLEGITNGHPTIKPLKLMEYLIRLITPHGGTVLDPFMGSGSTGVAAYRLGFKFIGCEMSEEYVAIAEKRIEAVAR